MTSRLHKTHALAADLTRVLAEHDLPYDVQLIVLAQMLGFIVSCQNREEYTPEGVMAMVAEHFQIGSQATTIFGMVQ